MSGIDAPQMGGGAMSRTRFVLSAALVLTPCVVWPGENPIGPEFRVNTYTTYPQQAPAVAADSSGNFIVVWQTRYLNLWDRAFVGQRYSNSGAPLGPEFRVNSFTTGPGYLAVAADSAGNFVVVWESLYVDGHYTGIFGQRHSSSGAPLGTEFRVNPYTTNAQRFPSVAADPSGNFVVVWTSFLQDGDMGGVFGQRFAASGAPLGAEFRVNTFTTRNQYLPSVAASAGNFVVVWMSSAQGGSGSGIFGQRYAIAGNPLGPEFRVNTYTTDGQVFPLVAVDPSGTFVIAWSGCCSDGWAVSGQRYSSSGASLGSEFRINTNTQDRSLGTSIAADSSGNFVVSWHNDMWGQDAFGQLFESSGSPIGPHFRINTYTTSLQTNSAVAADPSGHFLVVWESASQDGAGTGVFGQRFDSMTVPVKLMRVGVE